MSFSVCSTVTYFLSSFLSFFFPFLNFFELWRVGYTLKNSKIIYLRNLKYNDFKESLNITNLMVKPKSCQHSDMIALYIDALCYVPQNQHFSLARNKCFKNIFRHHLLMILTGSSYLMTLIVIFPHCFIQGTTQTV